MTKERLKNDFNVDISRVKFELSNNGLYKYSSTTKDGYYVIDNLDDTYSVVDEVSNNICKWRHNLHELEEV